MYLNKEGRDQARFELNRMAKHKWQWLFSEIQGGILTVFGAIYSAYFLIDEEIVSALLMLVMMFIGLGAHNLAVSGRLQLSKDERYVSKFLQKSRLPS